MTKGASLRCQLPLGSAETATRRDGYVVGRPIRCCWAVAVAVAVTCYGTLLRNRSVWCTSAVLPSSQSIAKSPAITSIDEMPLGSLFRKSHGPSVGEGHSAQFSRVSETSG